MITNMNGCSLPIVFGDESTRQLYELEVERARHLQPFPFCVAPRVKVLVPGSDTVIGPGGEVSVELLSRGPRSGIAELRRLIQSGHVLARDDAPEF